MVDIGRRMRYLELMYTDQGIVTNESIVQAPFNTYDFSILHAFGGTTEVTIFFWIGLLIAFIYTLGWRTKLFQVLLAVVLISIHYRNILMENGGDQVMNAYCIWSIFLPLGARYSVDSLLTSLRARREGTSAQLNDPAFIPKPRIEGVHLAYLGCLVQLTIIYFFNTVSKSGRTWTEGTSIFYLLQMDRQITPIGWWLRNSMPLAGSKLMTYGTIAFEAFLPFLILVPIRRWSRRLLWVFAGVIAVGIATWAVFKGMSEKGLPQNAVWMWVIIPTLAPLFIWRSSRICAFLLIIQLHLGIALLTNVGLFSFAMMAAGVLLLNSDDIDLVASWLKRTLPRPFEVHYDSASGLWHLYARIMRRFDVFGRITWVGRDVEERPEGVELTADEALVVYVPADRRVVHGAAAASRILRAVPFGFAFAWVLHIPGISHLANAKMGYLSRHRTGFDTQLGFTPGALDPDRPGLTLMPPPAPARIRLVRVRNFLRDCVVLFVMSACFVQMVNTNTWTKEKVPKFFEKHYGMEVDLSIPRPAAMSALINYARMYQKWNMFAPNVPKGEGWLVIDAKLADGRHIDPQTGEEPVFGPVDYEVGMDFAQHWRIYTKRIKKKRYKRFVDDLDRWLKRRHRFLELPKEERIVEYDVWWIKDRSPTPEQWYEERKSAVETSRQLITSFHRGKHKRGKDSKKSRRNTRKSRKSRGESISKRNTTKPKAEVPEEVRMERAREALKRATARRKRAEAAAAID